jgi:cell volume regulation protein A
LDVGALNTFLLVGALVIVLAVVAVRVSVLFGLPSLVLYLLIGLLLGEAVLGIEFDNAELAQALAFGALALILAEGGLTTRWEDVRPSFRTGLSLATIGVGVSTAVVAAIGHFVLGLDWQLAVLLGAVFAPTDAAAVFSTLRRVPLTRRTATTLEAESGLNDAPTVVLVTVVSAGEVVERGVGFAALEILYQLGAGALIGVAVGWLGAVVLRRVALPASGLYPLMVMTLAILAYASAATASASGFAAVYLAALVLGNSRLPHGTATRSFAEGLAWGAQIGLFVMLGLLASPSDMPDALLPALVIGLVLTLLARPLSVVVSCLPFRIPLREQAFMSWAGLRGATPVILATIPMAAGLEESGQLFAVVFVVTVGLTMLQAPTFPWAARKLDVSDDTEPRDAELESAPLERVAADLIQVRVPLGSRLHGVEVDELRLPPGVAVSLIVRADESFVPEGRTRLRVGDELLIVSPRALRDATEQRLRAVGRRGRLAGWVDRSDE